MSSTLQRKVILVTRKTRLEELIARHHTAAQAKFYIEHLGADFGDYQREHDTYAAARHAVLAVLEAYGRYQAIDRAYLANFLFAPGDVVLALGQDGLVANIMKYLEGQPLAGLNPEPSRYDGVLLPFDARDLETLLPEFIADRRPIKEVTMACATLTDRQTLYAVNDLFIGPRTHTSARYEIRHGARHEVQSSSGVIVSTGLGSTAWMKSVITGSSAIASAWAHRKPELDYTPLPWNADRLQFAVREPFPSKTSGAELAFGLIERGEHLSLRSFMPENGVIFSDGIESDYLQFNAGTEAVIAVAEKRGRLLV
ncbi:MAG: sugar kinase [Betaproteobacteria bacterium]|nr:sugar kinase [Betaproteobacteria bacterium]